MESVETSKKLFPKFSRADVTAFLALMISLAALGVSIYEAQIMREQQVILQTQQKASFFPYITQNQSFNFGEKGSYKYTIKNKGIGPAKIREITLSLNGEVVKTYSDLLGKLEKLFPKESNFSLSYFGVDTYFLDPKEKITMVELKFDEFENSYKIVGSLLFEYEICYCSIFEDCWSLNKEGEEPTEGCD